MRRPARIQLGTAAAIGSLTLVALATGCTNVSTGPAEPPATTATDRTETLARQLQLVLDGEYLASYSYGIVGALVTGTADRTAAARALQIHDHARDRLRNELTAMGREPAPPPAAYTLPFPVRNTAEARALAASVESALASDWDLLAAESPDPVATRARKAAGDCRARAATWSKGKNSPTGSGG